MNNIKYWFSKKFNSFKKAGIKFYGVNILLPIAIPLLVIFLAFISAWVGGALVPSTLKGIVINTALQFMYLSILTFLSIIQNIMKYNEKDSDSYHNMDFWISVSMLVIIAVFYGIQVYLTFVLKTISLLYLLFVSIFLLLLLYISMSIYSEYSEDSDSANIHPSAFANNREQQDNNDDDWESKL
mgnify:CR=1 FL=1